VGPLIKSNGPLDTQQDESDVISPRSVHHKEQSTASLLNRLRRRQVHAVSSWEDNVDNCTP